MTFNGIKATAAAAAVLIAASLAGPVLAQPGQGGYQPAPGYQQDQGGYDHQSGQGGYDRGDRNGGYDRGDQGGYDRDFGDRNFNDREFDQRGRFYYGGDIRQRSEWSEQVALSCCHPGQLNRWQADRVFAMLDGVRREARFARRDGFVSPREQMRLNMRLDETVRFLRSHLNRGPRHDDRRY